MKTIQIANMPRFEAKITKMIRKANRLGVPAVSYEIVGQGTATSKVRGQVVYTPYTEVQVHGDTPVLAGWKFLASIEHTENGNLVRSLTDGVTPETYRLTASACDHCHTSRNRIRTYIVQNEAGETLQVGSSCLADFVGLAKAEDVVEFYSWFEALVDDEDEFDESDMDGRIYRGELSFSLVDYLVYVVRVIAVDGWKSASSYGHGLATKYVALDAMFKAKENPVTDIERENVKSILAEVSSVLAGKDKLNDYEWNIQTIIANGKITTRQTGYSASIIPMAGRLQEQKIIAEKNPSSFIGEVGSKISDIKVTVSRHQELDTRFGITHLYAFVDDAGNQITWFSSNNLHLDAGEQAVLEVATVKEHKVYNGVKQTIITRGKIAS